MATPKVNREKRRLYEIQKQNGVCTRCGVNASRPKRTQCQECADKKSKRELEHGRRTGNLEHILPEPIDRSEPKKRDIAFWGCDCPFNYFCLICQEMYPENYLRLDRHLTPSCPKFHRQVTETFPLLPLMCIHDMEKEGKIINA